MARTFLDSSAEHLVLSMGAVGFNGAKGVVAQVKKTDDANSGCILYVGDATSGAARWSLAINDANAIEYTEGNSVQTSPSIRVTNADGFCLIGVSKVAGGIPRFHKYSYGTDTFTHENGTSPMADGDAPSGSIYVGKTAASAMYLKGTLNAMGVWVTPIEDVHFEAMAFDLSSFWNVDPAAVWIFDQHTLTMTLSDLTGDGANETSRSGTSAPAAADVMPSFSYGYDLNTWYLRPGVAGGAPPTPLPDTLLLSDTGLVPATAVNGTDLLTLVEGGKVPGTFTVTHLTDGASTVDGTSFNTAAVAPGPNELCLVAVHLTSTTPIDGVPTISGGGMTTWTQIDFTPIDDPSGLLHSSLTIFRALQASPGAAAAITITAPSSVSACAWSVDKIAGVTTSGTNGSGAIVQLPVGGGGGQGGGQTALCTFPKGFNDPDNLIWTAAGRINSQDSSEVCTGFTRTANKLNGDTAAPGTLATAWGARFEDVSWGWTSDANYVFSGFEIAAAVGGTSLADAGDYPLYYLEMNLNHPTSPNKAWVDISNRLVSWKKSGPRRQFELDSIEGGTIDLTLRNHDRALDPTFTAGPYYGSLFSNREIRFKMLWRGRWWHLFYGFIDTFDFLREGFSGNYTTFRVNDATEILSSETIDSGPVVFVTNFGSNKDLKFIAFGSPAGEMSQMEKKPLGGEDDPEGSQSGLGEDLSVEYKNFTYLEGQAQIRPVDNGIMVKIKAGTTDALTMLEAVNQYGQLMRAELAPGSNGSGFPPVMAEQKLGGGFYRALTGFRVNQVLNSLETPWPPGDRIIDAGLETLQASSVEKKNNVSALTHLVDAAVTTELGILYCDARGRVIFKQRNHRQFVSSSLTFTDKSVTGQISYQDIKPSYDKQKIFNEIVVNQNGNDKPFILSDLESKIKHRVRTRTITTLCANESSLSTIASTLLSRYKDQKMRYDSMRVSVALQPFPTGPVLDDFNRADENPLAGGWSGGNDFRLVSNRMAPDSTSGVYMNWVNGMAGPDVDTTIEFAVLPANGDFGILTARDNGAGQGTFYAIEWSMGAANTLSWNLNVRVAWAWTPFVSGTVVVAAGDAIRVRCSGSTIQAWVRLSGNWTLLGSAVDTTIAGTGSQNKAGIFHDDAGTLVTRYDNFDARVIPSDILTPLIDLQISDKVTVKRNPTAGTLSSPEISNDHFIEGMDIEAHENKTMDFTIYLSPA